MFLGEEESVFFKIMAPGKSMCLVGGPIPKNIHKHKLDSAGHFNRKESL